MVTDKGLIDFKAATKVTEMLDQANVSYDIYDEIVRNRTVQNVKDGVAFVEASKADAIVAIGGGLPIDTAKAIGIIMTNPEFSDVVSL